MKHYLFTVIFTAAVTLVLTWAVWQVSLRYKLYPGIRERDVHKTPTPRLGGIAMFLGVVAAFAISSQMPYFEIFWQHPAHNWAILGATLLIVVIGVVDDLWDLDWMIKLGGQFLAAGIVVGLGGVQIYSLPIGGQTVVSSWASFTLSVFTIVIVMNAVNFIDGLDGLVAGVALIANSVFFAYTYLLVRDFGASSYCEPRLLHRRRADGGVHRLPASELESGEALHGGCRRLHPRTPDGRIGDCRHRAAQPPDARRQRCLRPLAAVGCVHPDPLAHRRRHCCRSWTSAWP